LVLSDKERKAKKKEYQSRPEVKAKAKVRRATQEYKAKKKEYHSRPEVKAKEKEYHKKYRSRPEVKAKQKKRYSTPEYKAKAKVRRATPEYKAMIKRISQRPENIASKRKRETSPEYKAKNKVRMARPEYRKERNKEIYNLRLKVLQYYSKHLSKSDIPCCRCCGEKFHIGFLAIDHITGKKEMDSEPELVKLGYSSSLNTTSLLRWLIKNNFPKGFQILCHNCNSAKAVYGKCPHQK